MKHGTKRLGQHFLINKSAIKKIIADLDLKPDDTIIEIGPGKGALTFPLLEECQKVGCKIVAIEKDPALVTWLMKHEAQNLKIICGDALKEIKKICFMLHASNFKVVGNIPYYITGKLLRILSGLENKPALIVLMVQKEVAERICAQPKMNPVRGREGPQRASASNGMNLLAAAVQFWAEPKILFTLKPGDFNPPPKVESAIIKLTTNNKQPATKESENYYKLIKILFKQPRKTLFNNLKTGLKMPKNKIEAALKSIKIDPNSRPQNLSLKEIKGAAALLN